MMKFSHRGLGLLVFCAMVSTSPPVEAETASVPVEEFDANIGFVCPVSGMPTIWLLYGKGEGAPRELRFNQLREPLIAFELDEAIQSVEKVSLPGTVQWVIKAQGQADDARGIPEGTPVALNLTIHTGDNRDATADITVSTGTFSRIETGCSMAPPPVNERVAK